MIRDTYNIIPVSMAAILHALLVISLLFVFDFSYPRTAATPLAIEATLVSAAELEPRPPPPAREPEAESEPQDEQVAQKRIEAEEKMRQQELAAERKRLEEQAEAKQKRKPGKQRLSASARRQRWKKSAWRPKKSGWMI